MTLREEECDSRRFPVILLCGGHLVGIGDVYSPRWMHASSG